MFEVFPGYNATPELAMQLPMYHHSTPYAPDWNDDGMPDLWHHNHYVFSNDESRWSDPSMRRYGPGRIKGGCFVDWDAVVRDGDSWRPANEGGWLDWTDASKSKCFDVHSTTILDIDGDGVKDMYLTTGGGRGQGKSFVYDNLIFWGQETNSTLGFQLVGGRDEALKAGLQGRNTQTNLNERGRHQYWLDVNGDGRLDVLALNQERSDRIPVPSQLNLNMGGRKFVKAANEFDDFSGVALLTDVDGDGFAREVIVMSGCEKAKDVKQMNEICERSPTGTASVYSLDKKRYLVRESMHPQKNDFVRSIASADFDNDGIADVAMQWDKDIYFHLSSARQEKCASIVDTKQRRTCLMTIGDRDAMIDLRPICGTKEPSATMRFADFNLDGRLDLFLVCATPGLHALLEQLPDGSWRQFQNEDGTNMGMGSMGDAGLAQGPKGFCDGIPTTTDKVSIRTKCESKFSKEACEKVRYNIQFILCSQYAKNQERNKTTAFALGATVADLDNDGYVDAIIGHRFGSAAMFRNKLGDQGNKNKFLAIRVTKKAGAAASIGAIVKLKARRMGKNARERTTQMRVISSLSHVSGADGGSEDRIIFGLGKTGIPLSLTVQWPHCCETTIIRGPRLRNFIGSMKNPFELPGPPKDCDTSCLL